MANQLLLLQDVDDLGRSGEVVKVKPGYARNFLLPQKKAVFADKNTLRMQAKLKEEREKLAVVDRGESEEQAKRIQEMVLTTVVKVDQEGHMYGSVSAADVVHLFANEGVVLEKRNVLLPHPIKELGVYNLSLKLKESVTATFTLKVVSDAAAALPATEAPEQEG